MPCLYNSPERKSTSKALKRVLQVRRGASIAGFELAASLSPNPRGRMIKCRIKRLFPCNSLEFRGLNDQNQNTYRPYPHHCPSRRFAQMLAERCTERALCDQLRVDFRADSLRSF